MLSETALAGVQDRLALQAAIQQDSRPAEIHGSVASLLATGQLTATDRTVPVTLDEPVGPNKSLVGSSVQSDQQVQGTDGPVGTKAGGEPLSLFSASDLRKRLEKEWSLRMINERVTLPQLLLDPQVSDSDFAVAASANLVTKFPNYKFPKMFVEDVHTTYIENWRKTILALSVYYRHFKRWPRIEQLTEYLGDSIDADIIAKYLADPATDNALAELGVSSPTAGLSERQLLAIATLTSFSDARTLSQKLKSIGVKDWEFNNWLGYPKFNSAYRKITEDLLNEAQPVLNTALMQLAVGTTTGKPDLSSIKYLNEINGRWDPASRQVMDMRNFMTRVVDVLTQELSDQPELLNRIGAKLASAAEPGRAILTVQEA